MNDLISRQALIDAMYHEAFEVDSDLQKWDSGCWIRYKLFENVIENLPSAQPEIIRCGECAYRCRNWISTNEDGNVIHHCRQLDQMVEDDFYCGCAERKEE